MKKTLTTALAFCLIAGTLHAAGLPIGPPTDAPPPQETKRPERAQCGLNLLGILNEIQQYVLDHEGRLPAKLSDAFAGQAAQKGGCLACPSMMPRIINEGFIPSYDYVAPDGRTLVEARGDIIAYDAAPVHENGRNVLHSDPERDGRLGVTYLAEAKFQELLKAQRERWAKRGKKMNIITDDLIPLRGLDMDRPLPVAGPDRNMLGSRHFWIVVALSAGIIIILVLQLIVRSRNARKGSD
jgi:hypothetical protein